MSDKKYITFNDFSGRAILGGLVNETDTAVKISNPVMITVQQQQNGQMAVQLFPLFFQEFVVPGKDERRDNFYVYAKNSIALGEDFEVEPRIIEQYERIINPTLVDNNKVEGKAEEDPEVIKLFDE